MHKTLQFSELQEKDQTTLRVCRHTGITRSKAKCCGYDCAMIMHLIVFSQCIQDLLTDPFPLWMYVAYIMDSSFVWRDMWRN